MSEQAPKTEPLYFYSKASFLKAVEKSLEGMTHVAVPYERNQSYGDNADLPMAVSVIGVGVKVESLNYAIPVLEDVLQPLEGVTWFAEDKNIIEQYEKLSKERQEVQEAQQSEYNDRMAQMNQMLASPLVSNESKAENIMSFLMAAVSEHETKNGRAE